MRPSAANRFAGMRRWRKSSWAPAVAGGQLGRRRRRRDGQREQPDRRQRDGPEQQVEAPAGGEEATGRGRRQPAQAMEQRAEQIGEDGDLAASSHRRCRAAPAPPCARPARCRQARRARRRAGPTRGSRLAPPLAAFAAVSLPATPPPPGTARSPTVSCGPRMAAATPAKRGPCHDHTVRRHHHRRRPGRPVARRPPDRRRHDGRHRRAQAVRRHLRQHRLHADQDAGRQRLCRPSRAPRRRLRRRRSTARSSVDMARVKARKDAIVARLARAASRAG